MTTPNDSSNSDTSSLNYFNYFTEIEDVFVRRRKKHLFLSTLDWALMETWKEQGIPLHIVLRSIERAFDSFESKPRKRSVKSLLYCQEEVEAQFAEWMEARVGAHEVKQADNNQQSTVAFNLTAVREHLRSRRASVEALMTSMKAGNTDLAEALARTAARLVEIEDDLQDGATFDSRRLEDSLTSLERMLKESMFATVPSAQLQSIKASVRAELRPYKNHMDAVVYEQTSNNLVLKRLREHFSIPRLSLFYL